MAPIPEGIENIDTKPEQNKQLEQQDENEAALQDKPQDWTEYTGKFIEPSLPTQFRDKVNYKPTNENRILPPYKESDGTIYKGQWNKGEQNGYGQMLKPDGTYFKGLWKSGIFSEGGLLYPNGEFFIGTAKYGQRYFANGVIYQGEADHGIPHGQGEEIYPNGQKNQAFYQYGLKVQQESSQNNQ
ncbi:unnamed protein product [Paramecium sonneborni]|uniref:MORN repeat protein n=1 Tax=Paramecium sonneborni TaxID=65129 RepID=A0A8S1ME56_9CILI|nr:unnamed protein product [Paramecium sonneborni]CAD8077819.1 unnamed protein product [Paramecium sonneborni]